MGRVTKAAAQLLTPMAIARAVPALACIALGLHPVEWSRGALPVKEVIMSHGNLEGKLVRYDFWPACENCRLFAACKVQPRHPTYPHTWHWGREFASFPEVELIVRSWVGTSAIGQPHTGCSSYEVDPKLVTEPCEHHRHYLELEREKRKLESAMDRLEGKSTWTKNDEAFHASLFQCYRQILMQQAALRSTAWEARPMAVDVTIGQDWASTTDTPRNNGVGEGNDPEAERMVVEERRAMQEESMA